MVNIDSFGTARISVSLPKDEIDRFDSKWRELGSKSRSDAIRNLIQEAIKQ